MTPPRSIRVVVIGNSLAYGIGDESGRAETLRAPLLVAERILGRIDEIVAELPRIAPKARVFILGGYNPVPDRPEAPFIAHYLGDLGRRARREFRRRQPGDRRQARRPRHAAAPQPPRHFHPGGSAYEKMAERIAAMLAKESKAA